MIDLKIAELRKKKGMTQQELGDILGVSYQTVSKWENNVTMPDIAMLPALSRYFGVSVDALLGLVELEEAYRPSDSGQKEYWKNRVEYLKRTRKTLWKTEYEMQKRDYAIAMKIPHYMRKAGLADVGCRMNDRINYVVPGQEDYEQSLRDVICADHWDDEKSGEQMKRDIAYFMNHGMNREEAEGYCRQQNGIVRYLKEESGKAALTKFTGVMVAFGWKRG